MLHHYSFSLTVVAVLALFSWAAPNQPTSVSLRVEGLTKTIFEGTIITTGHNVTTVSGGNHHCDGTNNGENTLPGPTCTSALDNASKNLFTFDGTFSTQFDDFFITSIGGDTQTSTRFWGILLNYEFTPVGGCQQEVKANDEILFAFDAFNANAFLQLTGPAVVIPRRPTIYTVTDGQTGKPVAGATLDAGGAAGVVAAGTTSVDGLIYVTYSPPRGGPGPYKLKASKPGAIRSNQLIIQPF